VECFQDNHVKLNLSGNKRLLFHNFYKFTVLKVILKQFGIDILILCTFINTVSKLGRKNFSSIFTDDQIIHCIFKL
jgi:hypothetical protein